MANQYQHPVMIPPARRLTPAQIAAHRRLRLARAPKMPTAMGPPPAPPLALCKVGVLSWLLGAALALLCSLQMGCEPPPPSTVSIGNEFSLEQRADIVAGIDAWCAAVGWCPDVVSDGEGRIGGTRDYRSRNRTPGSAAFESPHDRSGMGTNPGASQVIVDLVFLDDFPDCTRATVWHELGHFGIEGHTASGMMVARPECVWLDAIDSTAADEWEAQQG